MLFVSQGRYDNPSDDFFKLLAQSIPMKLALTVLTKQDQSPGRLDYLMSSNLSVRIFDSGHPVTEELETHCTPLNSQINSKIMVVSAVHDNHAAVIYLNGESLPPHKINAMLREFF